VAALSSPTPPRLELPQRARAPEPAVRYLPCPICRRPMSRTNFSRVSGVIVDICAADGAWFDSGELDAVIQFLASGGLDRAKAKAQRDAKLEAERAAIHQQSERVHAEYERRYAPTERTRAERRDSLWGSIVRSFSD
jgi:Zn-finger nucleic acid-binding protein